MIKYFGKTIQRSLNENYFSFSLSCSTFLLNPQEFWLHQLPSMSSWSTLDWVVHYFGPSFRANQFFRSIPYCLIYPNLSLNQCCLLVMSMLAIQHFWWEKLRRVSHYFALGQILSRVLQSCHYSWYVCLGLQHFFELFMSYQQLFVIFLSSHRGF